MNRILITGVAGFIGSTLARRALVEGHTVVGVDNLSTGYRHSIPMGIVYEECDVRDITDQFLLRHEIDGIFHLAGQNGAAGSLDDPCKDLEVNGLQTLSLLIAAEKAGVKSFVFASSVGVYGEGKGRGPLDESSALQPLSPYGVSKITAENYVRLFSAKNPHSSYTSLRFFNVYGPGQDLTNYTQGIVSIYAGQALNSGKVVVKGLKSRVRDLVHVDDVVESLLLALAKIKKGHHTLNICSGEPTSVGEIIDHVLYWRPETTVHWDTQSANDPIITLGDPSLALKTLGWCAKIGSSEGIRATLRIVDS